MKRIVLLISLSLCARLLTGQDLKSYQGNYKFNGIEGEAKFNYQLNPANESILQGDFKFESSSKGSFSENIFERKAIIGRFELNKKVGTWTYLDEHHQVTLDQVVDFKVFSRLESQQVKISANYKSGLPHGKWTIEENTYEGDKLKRASQSDAIHFQDGNLVNELQYKTFKDEHTQIVRGKLLEGGILHGELAMVYESDGKLISEIRNYERGFLLGLVKKDLRSDELIEEVIFFNTIDKLKELSDGKQNGFRIADEVFGMTYRDGFLRDGFEYVAQSQGNQFLEGFLKKLLKNDELFTNTEGDLIQSPIHTKRFVYELSRADQKSIEEIPSLYRENVKKTSEYLAESTLHLLKNKSDSTLLAYSYIQLQSDNLKRMEDLFTQIESKRIQFLDVEVLSENYFSWVGTPDTVQVNYMDQEISEVIEYRDVKSNSGFFQILQAFLENQKVQLEKRYALLDVSLQTERNSEELLQLSKQIESFTEKVRGLYSNEVIEDPRSALLVTSISENILSNQLESLRTMFATDNEFVQKQSNAEMILNLLTTTEDLLPILITLYSDFDKLDMLYQEEVFNPFTYTRYNQRVQEKLFDSYEIVFEYYITQIQNSEDFNTLNSWINKTQILNRKMTELRGEDTRRLEKRLNREKEPLKLESLLGL
ncbi:hypothetical protein J2X69_002481 [Algoriphagus sp. 4150]|uniref:hypothetical protein n=1 Tax=Algoriphagus sp. 4150 TaxID=2817756 RepID=UPI0028566B6D|nr:hypothetical protein [Algoriphagus sp. 4150]MDR7130133.1 hypothetical protein [Algoriphagus sp. 4150]